MLITLDKCYNSMGYMFNFMLNYYLKLGSNSYE